MYCPHTNTDVRNQRLSGLTDLPMLLGFFRHKQTSAPFEYTERRHPVADFAPAYQHMIWMSDGSTRLAQVKSGVAFVVVDEDDRGRPVVEKWNIKGHRPYPTDWVVEDL